MNARRKSGRSVIIRLMLVVLMLGVVAFSSSTRTSAREASEQVVFSGVAGTNLGPVGYWIWCEAESDNPYVGRCAGAMYVYAQGLTKGVQGGITELATDQYQMIVASKDGSLAATLTNDPPVQRGPHNTVHVSVDTPGGSGSGSSDNNVVRVTGN